MYMVRRIKRQRRSNLLDLFGRRSIVASFMRTTSIMLDAIIDVQHKFDRLPRHFLTAL